MQPPTISASSLANWEDCPAKFRAANIERLPEYGDKAAAKTGTVVHYAAEHFVRRVHIEKIAKWSDADLLVELLKAGYRQTFHKADYSSREYKDALAMAQTWHARTDLSGVRVLSVEAKKRHMLKAPSGPMPLTYILDRLDLADNGDGTVDLHVVDYKGLALDTPIPTPSGWTTMGEIRVGDELYGGDTGEICRVAAKSEVKHKPCYRITFDDGSQVVCDDEHRWEVDVVGSSSRKRMVLTADEIHQRGVFSTAARRQRDLVIAHTPVQGGEVNLPIDPYVFGAWIGDGNAANGAICKPHPPLFDEIEQRGYLIGDAHASCQTTTRTVFGLITQLRALGVLNNKHIPSMYMRASYKQRLDLLRGIMDTDGHWNHTRKRAVLNTTNKRFADEVRELVCSLGWTANVFATTAHGFGRKWDAWQLWFTPTGEDAFLTRHPRDHAEKPYVPPTSTRPFRRVITAVEPVASVPTQCIEVDSPDHCFRFGRGFIKTHNTQRANETFEMLANKLQAQVYAVAMYAEYSSQYNIRDVWVHLDLLRHKEIGVVFSIEECREMYRWLIEQVELIRAMPDDKAPEIIGPGCQFCPRKGACESLRRHVAAGGGVDPDAELDELVDTRQQLYHQGKAISNLLSAYDDAIAERMRAADTTRVSTAEWVAAFSAGRGTRVIDPDAAAQILGPEILSRIVKVSVTALDELMESGALSDAQVRGLKALIRTEHSAPGVRITKAPKARKAGKP